MRLCSVVVRSPVAAVAEERRGAAEAVLMLALAQPRVVVAVADVAARFFTGNSKARQVLLVTG